MRHPAWNPQNPDTPEIETPRNTAHMRTQDGWPDDSAVELSRLLFVQTELRSKDAKDAKNEDGGSNIMPESHEGEGEQEQEVGEGAKVRAVAAKLDKGVVAHLLR